MLLGLSDRYDSLISEIQNIPLDEWKSEWVKNRVLTYKINAPADPGRAQYHKFTIVCAVPEVMDFKWSSPEPIVRSSIKAFYITPANLSCRGRIQSRNF
jgi:hypothetical protein